MARKKKASTWEFDPQRLDELNETELMQVARAIGYEHASKQMPREDLEGLVLGEDVLYEDPLEEIRELIYEYIKGNNIMLSALTCSKNCPKCPHDRVIVCFAVNCDLLLSPETNPIPA